MSNDQRLPQSRKTAGVDITQSWHGEVGIRHVSQQSATHNRSPHVRFPRPLRSDGITRSRSCRAARLATSLIACPIQNPEVFNISSCKCALSFEEHHLQVLGDGDYQREEHVLRFDICPGHFGNTATLTISAAMTTSANLSRCVLNRSFLLLAIFEFWHMRTAAETHACPGLCIEICHRSGCQRRVQCTRELSEAVPCSIMGFRGRDWNVS